MDPTANGVAIAPRADAPCHCSSGPPLSAKVPSLGAKPRKRARPAAWWPRCPDCGRPLDLHQPDPEDLARLLGTCRCGCWVALALLPIPGGWRPEATVRPPYEPGAIAS